MDNENKPGRVKKDPAKKNKSFLFSLSPLAVKRLLQIPKNERSRRVSKFLERINPGLDVNETGERIE